MANAITLIRSLLAFVVVAMLHTQTRNVYLAAAALERGMTAFGSSSMNRSKLGVLLVSSRLSRAPTGSRRLLPVRS